uniref:Uncharacterized protein n=1 Tax=Arundo donax TaxID=35708 RepID=A0A0A9ATU8_ARUDO
MAVEPKRTAYFVDP